MLVALIERIIFGVLLIAFLQVPIVADHYIQYLSGYYEASAQQVDEMQNLATQNGFSSVEAMLNSLQSNAEAVVQQDAENKRVLLETHQQIQQDLNTLQNGHYFQHLWFFLSPSQYTRLVTVLSNFKPSIPLRVTDIAMASGMALLISLLLQRLFAYFVWPGSRSRHHTVS